MGTLSPYVAPCLAYRKTIMPACGKDHLKIKAFKSNTWTGCDSFATRFLKIFYFPTNTVIQFHNNTYTH